MVPKHLGDFGLHPQEFEVPRHQSIGGRQLYRRFGGLPIRSQANAEILERREIIAGKCPDLAIYARRRRKYPDPQDYLDAVVEKQLRDPVINFQIAQGFQYCGILRGYRPEDEASCGHAALMAWLDPLHAPPGPPACEKSERPRKCA